ncbi:2-isopropylmalate synthase [Pelomyxa schiedti]|nr:2-isopropylmalate synthase [Pelomyxa schiedti]
MPKRQPFQRGGFVSDVERVNNASPTLTNPLSGRIENGHFMRCDACHEPLCHRWMEIAFAIVNVQVHFGEILVMTASDKLEHHNVNCLAETEESDHWETFSNNDTQADRSFMCLTRHLQGASSLFLAYSLAESNKNYVRGTMVHMAPQIFTNNYTIEGDLWGFGMAEMISGDIVIDSPLDKLPLMGYNGDMKDGVKHGRGFMRGADGGDTYEGDWHKNKCDGWGVYRWANGNWFEGLLRGGHCQRGTYHSENGVDEWEGEWSTTEKEMRMQGWGARRAKKIVTNPSDNRETVTLETVYAGEWDGDKYHGCGTWHSPAGDIYHGQFDHGKISGTGRALFGDKSQGGGGGSYVGEWRDAKFHGRGVRIWGDGTRYEGDWECGKEHGAGTKTWACDGTSIGGVWEMGVIKSGTKRWPNGDEFTGKFTMNGCCGEGTATFRSGGASTTNTVTLVGTFKKNLFQETKCGGGGGMCCNIGYGDIQLQEKVRMLQDTFEKQTIDKDTQKELMNNQIKELKDKMEQLSNNLHEQLEQQTELMQIQTKEFKEQEEYIEHTLQHIQQGMWVKSNQMENKCVMKEVMCPIDKVVRMEVERRFGVDESQQVVSLVVGQQELSLSDTSSTLSQVLLSQATSSDKLI